VFAPRLIAVVLLTAFVLPPLADAATTGKKKPASSQAAKRKTTSKKPIAKKTIAKKKKPTAKPKPAVRKPTAAPRPYIPPPPIPTPPLPTPTPALADDIVVISKSSLYEELEPPPPPPTKSSWWWPFGGGPTYKYLTPAVRRAIDNAPVPRNKWRYIIVHNSGTRQGNAQAFDFYHRRVRKMPNGLAYHFVIGNGTSSSNGKIEIGPRWSRQVRGGHVHSDYMNGIALGVCLVGDYNRDQPTKAQLEALDELIRYLRQRVGKIDRKPAAVKPHREVNPPRWPTDCPGKRFPYSWLRRFN